MFYSIFIVLTIINVIYGEIDAGCRELDPREKVYICPQILEPVCGSNKHTYGNMCDYCAERWKKQQDGVSWDVVLDHEGSCESNGADIEKPSTDPVFSDVPVEPGYQAQPIWSNQPYQPSTPYIQPPQTGLDLFNNLSPARHNGKLSWNWLNWFKQRPSYWFHGGYRPNTQHNNHRPNWNQNFRPNRYDDGQSSSSWSAGGFHPNAHSYGNGDNYGNNNYDNSPNNQDYNYDNRGQDDRYRPSLFDRFSSVMENQMQPAYRPQTTTSWRRVNCNEFGRGCAQVGMVCGSDRRYYSSECELCSTITQTGMNVRFVKDGQC